MESNIENWIEWKQKCDLRLCSRETQGPLRSYAQKQMRRLVGKALGDIKPGVVDTREIDAQLCWDLFEGFYAARIHKSGKAYKDWLFDLVATSPDAPLQAIRGLVSGLLYNVVRKYIRDNYPRKDTKSLDAPLHADDPDGKTLYDVETSSAVGVLNQVEEKDARGLAAGVASQFFTGMSQRERVVLAVLGLGLPASCPEAEAAAGCKKSMLAAARGQIDTRLKQRLKREMPEDSDFLRFYVVEALVGISINWAEGESCCEPIFRLSALRRAKGDVHDLV